MSLFFLSTAIGQEYFQAVIDAVTGDSNEDLSLLIDNAKNDMMTSKLLVNYVSRIIWCLLYSWLESHLTFSFLASDLFLKGSSIRSV